MADTFKGRVSMTPIVTVTGDTDADDKDVIHHDIKHTLGGPLEKSADAAAFTTARWYYSASTNFTATSANILSGTYTDGTATHTSDKISMIYVENLSTDSNGNETDCTALIAAGSGGTGDERAMLIEPGESFICKWILGYAPTIQTLHGDTSVVTSGNTNVNVKVVALCDDVA